ncbi:hypothetical protein HDU88_001622 [Geranomyces variabilis]|nr:hypothetical protein HDU88_001622 [Geranomyces variabilis]
MHRPLLDRSTSLLQLLLPRHAVSSSLSLRNIRPLSTMPGPLATRIEEKLQAALAPTFLEIIDDSAKHAGHAAMRGVKGGETHFSVTAVSEAFAGMRPVQRHQKVYTILDDELKGGLHALSLTTKTPAEYAK